MRISHKHKFVYIAITKTGSSTIRSGLDEHSEVTPSHDKESPLHFHVEAFRLKKYFHEQKWDWDEYFKFTIVRNPWPRIVSQWEYKLKTVHKYESKKYDVNEKFAKVTKNLLKRLNFDFNNFVLYLKEASAVETINTAHNT